MPRLNWHPIDHGSELNSVGKYSSCIFQRGSGKDFLFIHAGDMVTVLVTSVCDNRLIIDRVRDIPYERLITKIVGNDNCILMLDSSGELFYLKGVSGSRIEPFNYCNGYQFLENEAILTWEKLYHPNNCLDMIGFANCFAFLSHNLSLFGELYNSAEVKTGLVAITENNLGCHEENEKYFITCLKGEITKVIGSRLLNGIDCQNEVILIVQSMQLIFWKSTPHGDILSKPFSVNFHKDTIVTVLSFDKNKCILILCESGKVVLLKFNNKCRTFQLQFMKLPKKLYGAVSFENNGIKFFWSDLNNLYLTTITDTDDLINIYLSDSVRSVRHILKINNKILAVTINGCLYETDMDLIDNGEPISFSSNELLNRIYENSKIIQSLSEEIDENEKLIKALEMSNVPNITDSILMVKKNGSILLVNNTNYVIQRNLWKLQFEVVEVYGRKYLEIKKFESDIQPGESMTFSWNHTFQGLNVTLFCNPMPDVTLLINLKFDCDEIKIMTDVAH